MNIWFASGNMHKKAELAAILGAALGEEDWELKIPSDAGLEFNPDETEMTFHGNALLKARELHSLLNARLHQKAPSPLFKPDDLIIADDSGICVDALNGRPGIFSARYTGNRNGDTNKCPLTSSERNVLLLEEIGDNPLRTARFVCSMVLLCSPDRFFAAQETLEGEIVKGPQFAKGTGGFGYDPILYIPAFNRTVAELSEDEKNAVSHRGKAGNIIAKIIASIKICFQNQT